MGDTECTGKHVTPASRLLSNTDRSMRRLSSHLASYFTRSACAMGAQYHARGRVEIVFEDEFSVLSFVYISPTRVQDAGFHWSDGALYCSCDCSQYRPGTLCEHLWATVLEADELEIVPPSYLVAPLKPVAMELFERIAQGGDSLDAIPDAPKVEPWRQQIATVGVLREPQRVSRPAQWPERREFLYSVPAHLPANGGGFTLELYTRDRRKAGDGFTKAKPLRIHTAAELPDSEDREIVSLLQGATPSSGYSAYGSYYAGVPSQWQLSPTLTQSALPRIAQSGRLYLRTDTDSFQPVGWDGGEPWRLKLRLSLEEGYWTLDGHFEREGAHLELSAPSVILSSGFVLGPDTVSRLDPSTPLEWLQTLRRHGPIRAPESDRDEFIRTIFAQADVPAICLPEELPVEEVTSTPVPALRIQREEGYTLQLHLSFRYGEVLVPYGEERSALYDPATQRLLRRDCAAEQSAARMLQQFAGPCYEADASGSHWHAQQNVLPALVSTLVMEGWLVELNGSEFRTPGESSLAITSGIDWFDLEGSVDYGGSRARLPALLEAMKRNDSFVRLDDGTLGLLPTDWLNRLRTIAGMGELSKDRLRFKSSQAGFLDALLATQPEVSFDEGFAHARGQLNRFQGIRAVDQPPEFGGTLREYQREGLGWLRFLDDFGFGGCLADDMGVGKTVQVLALLEQRRVAADRKGPFLVVVPRSLIFNWMAEAARFTPSMRVLDHTGAARSAERFGEVDLVLTTYGTVRRDIVQLKNIEFDYVVLDEAQAIKNSATDTAKAVRLLRGRRRLAMSGTPVENHLGELWSLFEFLNPGMLGGAKVLRNAGPELRNPSEEMRAMLGHALRPYILRRTKGQVAKELPDKTEQTVFCELDAEQRRLYNEMREYYRVSLLSRVDTQGLAKSKMHVLEALLRLRQAACHPGLLDAKRKGDSSAKLDALMGHLESVLGEGHKALVFSQFTSLLAIVRNRLDKNKVTYEYLDGQTRNREECVHRFQNDADCGLFLVSLKAGGLGLNLTAAEYVFLLDPWWNPAVESQAIDRAHRIGQTRRVFAYRLIARDTVEEKVLELQKTKRGLADAIINADNSLVRGLAREDLELLLS
ncbi:MAG: SNF2-related protein [Bryobacteraceae bacterium]